MSIIILSQIVSAQSNFAYFPTVEGRIYIYSNFNAKGQKTSSIKRVLLNKMESNKSILYNYRSDIFPVGKDSSITENFSVVNDGTTISVNISNYFSDLFGSYSNLKLKMKGDALNFPPVPEVGQKLKDASLTIDMYKSNMLVMGILIDITDREIVGRKTITVDGGTFEVIQIDYNLNTKMGRLDDVSKVSEYYNKDDGLIKSETYSANGILISSQKLMKIVGK